MPDLVTGDDHEMKFLNRGIDFKAKVVGDAVVPAPRGEKMCHDTMKSLKVVGCYCRMLLLGWAWVG
jgi:hypothetical protein